MTSEMEFNEGVVKSESIEYIPQLQNEDYIEPFNNFIEASPSVEDIEQLMIQNEPLEEKMTIKKPYKDNRLVRQILHRHTSKICGTSFNFVNSILGPGIAGNLSLFFNSGIPYAMVEAGLWTGITLLIVIALVTNYSVRLLIRTGKLCGAYSYEHVGKTAFGIPGQLSVIFFFCLFTFFAMTGYLVQIGDCLPYFFGSILGKEQ
jgi:hypothetical protein